LLRCGGKKVDYTAAEEPRVVELSGAQVPRGYNIWFSERLNSQDAVKSRPTRSALLLSCCVADITLFWVARLNAAGD